MNVEISVTDEDIAAGERGSCGRCPVARAVRRSTGADGVRVNEGDIEISMSICEPHMRALLPRDACIWISRFDERGVGEPFTFTADFR